jgi:superfamily II DNA helicase RecQ
LKLFSRFNSSFLFRGDYRVLYLTPEFVSTNSDLLEELNNKVGICLLAVDECHVVSQWGNDFRPSYRQIGELLRARLSNVPFMALTATATPIVRRDIVKSLYLKKPLITVTSFDRFDKISFIKC